MIIMDFKLIFNRLHCYGAGVLCELYHYGAAEIRLLHSVIMVIVSDIYRETLINSIFKLF